MGSLPAAKDLFCHPFDWPHDFVMNPCRNRAFNSQRYYSNGSFPSEPEKRLHTRRLSVKHFSFILLRNAEIQNRAGLGMGLGREEVVQGWDADAMGKSAKANDSSP